MSLATLAAGPSPALSNLLSTDDVVRRLEYGDDDEVAVLGFATLSSLATRDPSTFPVRGDTTGEVLDDVKRELRRDSRCPAAATAPFVTGELGCGSARERDDEDDEKTVGDGGGLAAPLRDWSLASTSFMKARYS